MTYISWFNSFALYFQEHVMYGQYAFDYESVGSVKHGNHLTVYILLNKSLARVDN